MPYVEKLALEGADHDARAAEMYGLLDGALAAHPAWSKVTDGYTGNSYFDALDVWANDGSADGYQWYLLVGRGTGSQASYQGRVMLGGALEYDPATTTAKKALRGYSGAGYVDADGYPLVSAGGAEMEFPLSTAQTTTSGSYVAMLSHPSAPPAVVAGQWVRVLVTDRVAWIGWGTPTTLVWSHGVGTYTNLHSATADQRPLAHHAVPYGSGPVTVWQHPDATDVAYSRSNNQYNSTSNPFLVAAASALYGEVGATVDLLRGGPVGSRLTVQRNYTSSRESPNNVSMAGGFLGLSPSEFLVFDRASGVQIGDTITVAGKAYVSVDTPSSKPSLFVCAEPEV